MRPSRDAAGAARRSRTSSSSKPEEIDRVGLVGFAGTSLDPLVPDDAMSDSILFYLDWIADDPAILYGTDIGAALTSAMEVVRRDDQPTRKLFLVISDGEDHGATLAGRRSPP